MEGVCDATSTSHFDKRGPRNDDSLARIKGSWRSGREQMTAATSAMARFLSQLRAITARTEEPRVIVAQASPLVRDFALSKTWLEVKHYDCNVEQGFGAHLLHEEPHHTLAIFAGSWLPRRGAPPHNHGTWAVVAGVDGAERNTFWVRVDDGVRPGYAEIRRQREQLLGPGDVVTFQPDSIHSVINETAQVTVSLHVYGKHVNYTNRSQFDPERKSARAFIVKVDDDSARLSRGLP